MTGAGGQRLTVILPTLNERENLERLIPGLLREVARLGELLVVDDGSTDGTREVVERFAAADARVRLIARADRPCLTAAIQAGIDAAGGDCVAWMDADLSMTPADLVRLADALGDGVDMVVGSRFVVGGAIKGQLEPGILGRLRGLVELGDTNDSRLSALLSWMLNAGLLPLVLGGGPHDYTSGFVVARRAVFDELRLRGDHGEYFIDLWVRARRLGFRIEEVGYRIRPRSYGTSKTADSLAMFWSRGRRYIAAAVRARLERR
jgi:dolichol-phosphate mannosyltransferase